MRGLIKSELAYPNLWRGCVGAWCPSVSRSRSTILEDFSPARNHGTLTAMEAEDWDASQGKIALKFDGGSAERVTIAARALTPNNQISVCGWAYQNNWTNPYGAIFDQDRNSNCALCLNWGGSGVINWMTNAGAGRHDQQVSTGTSGNALITWQHFTATYDASAGVKLIYVRGFQVSSSGVAVGTLANNANAIYLGCLSDQNCIDGYLDDCRVYNRVLTPPEIALLATRRGIAYETTRNRSYKAAGGAPATSRRNNMLIGCGF